MRQPRRPASTTRRRAPHGTVPASASASTATSTPPKNYARSTHDSGRKCTRGTRSVPDDLGTLNVAAVLRRRERVGVLLQRRADRDGRRRLERRAAHLQRQYALSALRAERLLRRLRRAI